MSVPQSDISQGSFLWTCGIAARETMHYLDRHGIDAGTLLSKASLSRTQLMQDPEGISSASQHRFLELAAVKADDRLLGLHVAAEMDLREIGLLFYLQASSATVMEALERLARYAATATDEINLGISQEKDETLLTVHRVLTTPGPCRQHSELCALAFIRVLRQLTNRDFAPLRMTFAHVRREGLRELHCVLRCPTEFGQLVDSSLFPRQVMNLPIVSEDHRLLRILEAHADELLLERRSVTSLRHMAESELLRLLPSGRVTTTLVAEHLGMSERSFRRRLAEEGTSFGEIVDQLRHRLALRYLEDPRPSLKQIAWLLGYSEPGAFNHAFKRWTGTSPRRAKTQSRSAASP